MKKVITLTLLIIAFLFTFTEATTNALNNGSLTAANDPPKPSFMFAVAWPPGFCQTQTCAEEKPEDLPQIFTIHSLRLELQKYDFRELSSIYADLLKYWPNILKSTRPEKFWGEEWDKHGATCNLFTVKGYFDEALRLYKLVEPGLTLLADNKIVPRKTTVESIQNLKAFEGKKPFVLCKEVGTGSQKKNYLEELRFCINGNKQFINCGPQTSQNQYCKTEFQYGATKWKSLLGAVDEEEDII